MKINLSAMVFLLTVLCALESPAQEAITTSPEKSITPEDLKNLIGEWTGTLTYMDYTSNKPYTMPANLMVKQGKNEKQLVLFNTYPNEPKANSKGKITVSRDGKLLNKKELRSKKRLPNGQLQITTEYEGKDNKKKASIRNVYILGERQFVIRKEVRFDHTSEWIKRSEFSYTR
ncbi:MAG: hypothetical protein H6559_35710 [Lewinellaceae bacterium]|nr:hypothetical protein [Lewinellaceae bacterium]